MKRILCIFLILILMFPAAVFAEGGDGSGSGGKDAVSVGSTSVEDGASIGPEDPITITFTNNVNNQKVRETNQALFSLADENGNPIEIDVVMYDDQVEPEHKRDITIVPVAPLAAGKYTLTAHAGITAKNGSSMAEDFILTFTVSASGSQAETIAATEEPTPAPTAEPTKEPVPQPTEAPSAVSPSPSSETGAGLWIILAAVLIAAAVAVILIVRNRNKKA